MTRIDWVGLLVLAVTSGATTALAGAQSGDVVYHSPTALAADSAGKHLYVADKTGSQVVEVDLRNSKVTRTFPLPGRPTGVALSKAADRLYVTGDAPSNCVFVVDLARGKVESVLPVGHGPMAPVLSADESTLYVCNRFNNDVSVIDLKQKRETKRLPLVRDPVAAALTPDGKLLVVGNQDPEGPATGSYVASAVSLIDAQHNEVISNIRLPNGGVSIRDVAISPDGHYAFVSHLLARNNASTTQLENGWMTTNAVSVIDLQRRVLLSTLLLDQVNRGAGNPWGVACTPDGRKLCVALSGVHELAIIELPQLLEQLRKLKEQTDDSGGDRRKYNLVGRPDTDLNFLQSYLQRIPLKGRGPRPVVVRGGRAYLGAYFTGTVESVDLEKPTAPSNVVLVGQQPRVNEVRLGEMLFHDASRSLQGWLSCSTCHPSDARPDGLNWDLLNDGFGNSKQVKSLLLAHKTPPAMITGIRETAEVAVRSGMKFIQYMVLPEADAVAIDDYLKSLKPVPSPFLVNGKLSAAAERGKKLFETAKCSSCHPPPLYTNLKKARVQREPIEFDTPTLIEVWRTAPYLYDGRAKTMREVLTTYNPNDDHGSTARLSENELNDLIEYVLSL